jgi:hypothetical protein
MLASEFDDFCSLLAGLPPVITLNVIVNSYLHTRIRELALDIHALLLLFVVEHLHIEKQGLNFMLRVLEAMPWLCGLHIAAVCVRFKACPHAIFGGQSGTGRGFTPITSVFLCQYHSTKVPHSCFVHLPTTLCNFSN